jgi:hypothetical protein
MNEHARYLELATAGIDFLLSPTDEAQVRHHLARCESCRASLEAIRADGRGLTSLASEIPVPSRVRVSVLGAALADRPSGLLNRPLLVVALVLLLVALAAATVTAGARLLDLFVDMPPRVTVLQTATDPIGDGTVDIVAVTTSQDDDDVIFEVEFADDYAGTALSILIFDRAKVAQYDCWWWSEYQIIADPEMAPVLVTPQMRHIADAPPLDYAVSGPRITIRVPRMQIGSPPSVNFTVDARRFDADPGTVDYFPDRGSDPLTYPCERVSLVAEPQSSFTSIDASRPPMSFNSRRER